MCSCRAAVTCGRRRMGRGVTPLLIAEGLRKRFGRHLPPAVDNVSFTLFRGETLALVGESGAGKSTVGRILLRLTRADAGRVEYRSADSQASIDLLRLRRAQFRRHYRPRIQMIFQNPYKSFDPRMTIAASLREPLRYARNDRTAENSKDEIVGLLGRVGIRSDQAHRRPYELSGGQLQRVAIARALATEPDIIVCDEPVTALDMSLRANIVNLLRRVQSDLDVGLLFITHDLLLVRTMADRVAIMYAGRIVEIGVAADIFLRPAHPYTRVLLDSVPQPDPRRRALLGPTTLPEAASQQLVHTGCAFVERCQNAVSQCRLVEPELSVLEERESVHLAACYNPNR